MTNLKSAFKHISFVKSCSTDLSEERSLKFCPWCDAQDVCETQWAVSTNTGPEEERFTHKSVNQIIQSPMQKQRWSRRFEGSFIAHKLTLVKKYPHKWKRCVKTKDEGFVWLHWNKTFMSSAAEA